MERASLMFSLVAIGTALNRRSQIYNTVFMSAFVMLIVNPDFLYDVGFQLRLCCGVKHCFFNSLFAAASGWVTKRFAGCAICLPCRWQRSWVLGFTLYYFHQFPNYFLLTNVVAIPLSTLVIYFSHSIVGGRFCPVCCCGGCFFIGKWSLWFQFSDRWYQAFALFH